MKRLLSITGGLLAVLALIALAVILALTFGEAQRGAEPISQPSQSPIETPTPPSPTATPTTVPTPIPHCTFTASPVSTVPGPPLDKNAFSEPQVVLTHTAAIGIAGWLPDSQRLLITRLIPGQPREYIETFNVPTRELQRYGERNSFDAKPIWLTAERAVAFADVSPDKQVGLRISRGEGTPIEEVVSGLAVPYLTASPDGRQVIFFTKDARERPEAFDVAQTRRQPFPFTLPLTPWQDLPTLGQQVGPEPYRAAWDPNVNWIAFYNDTGFYLADVATGQICEVDLGAHANGKRWAMDARWSPNGYYLAILTTVGDLPVKFSDLTILDTVTGELRSMHPKVYINSGQYYVTDIAWAPNSRHLAVLGVVRVDEVGVEYQGLYLTDTASGKFQRVFPDREFGGAWGGALAWSPNGLQLAVLCPETLQRNPPVGEGGLCLLTGVHRTTAHRQCPTAARIPSVFKCRTPASTAGHAPIPPSATS